MNTTNAELIKDFLGPLGGQLALAFAAGCAAGYAFCMRTLYKMLKDQKKGEHDDCMERIGALEKDKDELKARVLILEDRLYHGGLRQAQQIRESTVHVLGREKLGGARDDADGDQEH